MLWSRVSRILCKDIVLYRRAGSYLQLLSGLSQCIVELLLCGLGNCPTVTVSIPLGMMATSKTCMSDVPFDMPVHSKIKVRILP